MDQAQIQVEIETEMIGRGWQSYQRKVQLNIEKGRESDNPYCVNMMQAGLGSLSEAISLFCDRAWKGKPGPKAIAAVLLSEFPDHDVVSYITFKAILDSAGNHLPTAAGVAIKIGNLLEDELRFSIFEEKDPKFFKQLKNHISDTKHHVYRRSMMLGHMRNKGYQFKNWNKHDKLRVGLKLIELMMQSVGLIQLTTRGNFHNKTRRTYIEFTEASMAWIKRQRSNRLAAYPLFMPCLIKPRDWPDGGYYSERLRKLKEVKTRDLLYLCKLRHNKPIAFYDALNSLQGTEWEVNTKVLDAANYCWDTGTEVGGLIDAEPLAVPPKPFDIDTNDISRKKWRREAAVIHDINAHNRAKRFQCLTLLDTADRYKDESLFHVQQADFTGRIYPVSGLFNPQGNDLARGFHRFAKGAPIKNETDANWLAIAGANHWGLSKASFKERIEWAYAEGRHIAWEVAGNPDSYIPLWSKAEEPFQFLAWCIDFSAYLEQGFGFISKHPVLLDGTNNGYQHFAALSLDKDLASSVNLCESEELQDLYENIRTNLIVNLSKDEDFYAQDWFAHREFITRKLIKKPIMMIPYSGTTYGISLQLKDYVSKQGVNVPWGTDSFKHYKFLAEKIKEAAANVCPTSTDIMNYLNSIARCFSKEGKPIQWETPSGFLVKQSYYKCNSKQIKTKMGYNTIKLSIQENTEELDTRRTTQSFPANFIHSLDAANVHLALQKAKSREIDQVCTIHDCFGAPAGHIEGFINCAKESFVQIYQENVLDDLYNQSVKQLDKSDKLSRPLDMGDFDINEVMSAPYVFS
tara:strand:+ start:2290 stop:4692 length:2403 start_codon:yes stop_codon:yes gene_type:complete